MCVCGGNDKSDDIEVENYSSQSNQVVEIRTGESNQSVDPVSETWHG